MKTAFVLVALTFAFEDDATVTVHGQHVVIRIGEMHGDGWRHSDGDILVVWTFEGRILWGGQLCRFRDDGALIGSRIDGDGRRVWPAAEVLHRRKQ